MIVEAPPIEKDIERLALPCAPRVRTPELLIDIFIEEGCPDVVSKIKADAWVSLEELGLTEKDIASGALTEKLRNPQR